jgi:hypothetical protein
LRRIEQALQVLHVHFAQHQINLGVRALERFDHHFKRGCANQRRGADADELVFGLQKSTRLLHHTRLRGEHFVQIRQQMCAKRRERNTTRGAHKQAPAELVFELGDAG